MNNHKTVDVSDKILVFSDSDGRVNSVIILGKQGTVVVDTQVTLEHGRALRDFAKEMSAGRPLVAVVLTHEHFDHIAGNQFFDCPIISTEPARKEILEIPPSHLPEGLTLTPPTLAFTRELSLYLGDMTLKLRHEGGHCPGECSIFIPETGTLIAGDSVFNGRTPYVGDADVPRWVEVLTRLHAMDPEVVIPGHGEPGPKSILLRQRDWLETFLDIAHQSRRAGLSAEAAADKVIADLRADPARKQVIIAGIRNVWSGSQ